MAKDRENQVREKAYQLWQAEGEPHGRDQDHWSEAERHVGTGDDASADAGAGADAGEITPDTQPVAAEASGLEQAAVEPAGTATAGATPPADDENAPVGGKNPNAPASKRRAPARGKKSAT